MNQEDLITRNYSKLPNDLKDYLQNSLYKKDLENYSKQFELSKLQKDILEKELLFILLGITDYNQLNERLSSIINLNYDKINNLNQLIKKDILNNWLDILNEFKKEIEEDKKISSNKFNPPNMFYSLEQLSEAFDLLPVENQKMIQEFNLENEIQLIGNNNKLHIDQIGALGEEIIYLLLGLTKINNFLNRIEKRLQLSPGLASQLVSDINKRIILPMRIVLRKSQSNQIKNEELFKNKEEENIDFKEKLERLFSRPLEN